MVIRNRHTRYINTIGFLLSFISALLFLREMILAGDIIIVYLAGVLFIAGLLIWNFVRIRKKHLVYFSKALLIAGLVWTKMPYFQWLVFVFVALALLEYQARLPLEIGFSSRQITFNSLLKRRYQWDDVNNVVLRDGLLTIDFENNRLFQKEIDEGEKEASEKEFNNWCMEQLQRNSQDITVS